LAKNLRGLPNLGQFGTNGFFWKTIVPEISYKILKINELIKLRLASMPYRADYGVAKTLWNVFITTCGVLVSPQV